MNEGYVLVVCLECSHKELTPMFTGESTEDLYCLKCGSNDIEVW